ncbi:MAG: hypothetical protein WAO95_03235 [Burkholderiales bacterium]
MTRWFVCAAAALLAGCASYDGRNLAVGRSTDADVAAEMGKPAAEIARANGERVWYYPRGPLGRHTYAVVLGPDGRVRAVEQRLTPAYAARIAKGISTAAEVRELLGPPSWRLRDARRRADIWEYATLAGREGRILRVEFSEDGVVREVIEMRDPTYNTPPG